MVQVTTAASASSPPVSRETPVRRVRFPTMSTCLVDDCTNQAVKRGWCGMHYRRWQRHGDVHRGALSDEQRFWSYVDKDGPVAKNHPELGPCWLWTGGLKNGGYGQFHFAGGPVPAHRWLYERLHGPVAERCLDHFACDNPPCVNPAHVRPASDRENVLRGIAPSAQNARKTHCDHGHEFTPENTERWGPDKAWRRCRTCTRATGRESKRRARAAATR